MRSSPRLTRRQAVAAGQAQSDVVLPASWANTLLGGTLAWERWWLPRWNLPIGLSLLVLAQKPGA